MHSMHLQAGWCLYRQKLYPVLCSALISTAPLEGNLTGVVEQECPGREGQFGHNQGSRSPLIDKDELSVPIEYLLYRVRCGTGGNGDRSRWQTRRGRWTVANGTLSINELSEMKWMIQ